MQSSGSRHGMQGFYTTCTSVQELHAEQRSRSAACLCYQTEELALTTLSSTGEEYTRVSKMHYSLKATMGDDLVDASTDFVSPVRDLSGSPLTSPCSG